MASDDELRSTIEHALAAAMQNNWAVTQRLCAQVVAAGPTNPAMEFVARKYHALALCFVGYKTGDRDTLEKALTEARQAVRVFQRTNEPKQNVAGAYRAIGMAIGFMIAQGVIANDEWPTLFPEGVAALEKAIELDPDDNEARKHLGILNSAREVAKMQGAKTGGCFIATAACSNPFAPEVLALSAFRDDVLLRSRIGTAFVRLYYAVSPPVAAVIARSAVLRRAAMALVVRPGIQLIGCITRREGQ